MKHLFKRCPKSNRIVGFNYNNKWFWMISPIVAIFAFIWFLIRVIPKPQRATYPCQRLAMSLFGGFFAYLAGSTFIGVLLQKARQRLSDRRISSALVCLLAAGLSLTLLINQQTPAATIFSPPDGKNQPIGIGQGIHPGRVVFSRDERTVTYRDGVGNWWEDENTNPEAVDWIFTTSLTKLTGEATAKKAWSALFLHFNQKKTGTASDYKSGEKIVIKLNQNQDDGTGWTKDHMTAPQLLDALLSDLTEVVGVAPSDITLIDASRNFSDCIYHRISQKFPGVRMVAQNRIKPERDTKHPIYFSGDQIPTGYVPKDYADASYMINIGLFRVHNLYGVTFCAKNHFGSVDFDNADKGKFLPTPMHNSAYNGYDSYSPLTDLIAHDMIGGKTMLYLVDALYTSNMQNFPVVTRMETFGGKTPCGIFASQDPVAIESVCLDFIAAEPTLSVMEAGGNPDNFLHEAAKLKQPPSGTRYDPNHSGKIPASLGVHEHWNNSVDRQYSRNLGKSSGIELITVDETPSRFSLTVDSLTLNGTEYVNGTEITGEGKIEGRVSFKNASGLPLSPLVIVRITGEQPKIQMVRFPVTISEKQQLSFSVFAEGRGTLMLYFWEGLSLQPLKSPVTWKIN